MMGQMDEQCLVTCMDTRKATDAGRRAGSGSTQQAQDIAMVTLMASRGDINHALSEPRPPHQPPDLPHYQAKDLKTPKTHQEAMASEHGHLWMDSERREIFGVLDAGTFEPAE